MLADLYLTSIGAEPFPWSRANLDVDGSSRATYIAALIKAAQADEYEDLIRFARHD
jgi:hypothetical protein